MWERCDEGFAHLLIDCCWWVLTWHQAMGWLGYSERMRQLPHTMLIMGGVMHIFSRPGQVMGNRGKVKPPSGRSNNPRAWIRQCTMFYPGESYDNSLIPSLPLPPPQGVLPAVLPEQLRQLLSSAGPFEAAYRSASLSRLSDAVATAFPGTSRSLPSPADVQKCIG